MVHLMHQRHLRTTAARQIMKVSADRQRFEWRAARCRTLCADAARGYNSCNAALGLAVDSDSNIAKHASHEVGEIVRILLH